jgi:AcrR family transcriptional regulator
LLAAAKQLIAKHGYLGVRLEDIGGAAGVSGPAVYRHFVSKDAVLAEPELILIYDRDRFHLPPEDLQDVRRTQRAYVEIWVEVISAAAPSGRVEVDRTRAHAVIGLINSTPRIPGPSKSARTREVLTAMALGALGLDPGGQPRAGRPRR